MELKKQLAALQNIIAAQDKLIKAQEEMIITLRTLVELREK